MKLLIKNFLLLFIFSSFASLTVYAKKSKNYKFKNCTTHQSNEILDAVRYASEGFVQQIELLDRYIYNNSYYLSKNDLKQLKKARSIFSCSRDKVKYVRTYRCVQTDKYVGAVFKNPILRIIYPEIFLSQLFFDKGINTQENVIMHEISHMCGSIDGKTYFLEQDQHPNKTLKRNDNWGKLAPLFDYWYRFGICIPTQDC